MSLKNILLIDDSEAEQFLFKSIIEVFDPEIDVTSAYDGQEAMELLNAGAAEKIDAILMDINMPRINGFQFLDLYQEQYNENDHVIVTMVTSSSQTTDKDKAMTYSVVNKYFEKPLTAEHLETLAKIAGEKS